MIIEENNIYMMDCLQGLRLIPDNSIDLIVTDPPYQIDGVHEYKGNDLGKRLINYQGKLMDDNLVSGFDTAILDEMYRVMKVPNIYIWCNIAQVPMYIKYFALEKGCKMDILIWHKTNPMPCCNNKWLTDKEYCLYFRKGGYCNPSGYAEAKTVWHLPTNVKDKKLYGHPTIKPLPIIENIIRNSSKEGDVVLDAFIGSGTTAVACIKNGRKYLGFENNEVYYEVAQNRIKQTLAER